MYSWHVVSLAHIYCQHSCISLSIISSDLCQSLCPQRQALTIAAGRSRHHRTTSFFSEKSGLSNGVRHGSVLFGTWGCGFFCCLLVVVVLFGPSDILLESGSTEFLWYFLYGLLQWHILDFPERPLLPQVCFCCQHFVVSADLPFALFHMHSYQSGRYPRFFRRYMTSPPPSKCQCGPLEQGPFPTLW
ncbi:hypothetical protein DFS33DRAFT_1035591 [Desarmillaria ectypa]|nr:hypothetical protein DFS33DRAFT_1035591 [Desarmillaria ectypa]